MSKKTTIAALAVLSTLLAWTVLAEPLPPNTVLNKPGVGLPPPNYTAGLPSYFTPANLVTSLSAPMTIDFVGTVTTDVYANPAGGYTFAYRFINEGGASDPELVRATFNPANWGGVAISDAGADASGNSTPNGIPPSWSDGDPYFIGRASEVSGSYPYFQWRVANSGTSIRPGDQSSLIWLETDTASVAFSSVGLVDGGRVGLAQVLVVPAPAAAVLGLLGLGVLGWIRRR